MKPRTRPKDYSHTGHMGRIPVIAVAILFLIAAVLSALPSVEEWNLILHQYALAGFETAAETTRAAVEAGTDGVKFHLLHVMAGTDLAEDYGQGKFPCLTLEEYAQWLKLCLDQLPEHIVVHRITGDGSKRDLIAPLWSGDKKRVLNYLNRALQEK